MRLLPYATDVSPHARAELYNINNGDLQQLIKQSGLPAQYLQALAKYRTPYFAVMHLTGLSRAETTESQIERARHLPSLTHHIAGRYVYPLGTGGRLAAAHPHHRSVYHLPRKVLSCMTPGAGGR